MPLRDTEKYKLSIKGEPPEVTDIRRQIVEKFDNLEFVDEGHKYFVEGKELMSVSNVAHLFSEHFDTESAAEKYAQKHGETPEYWKDKWQYNSLKATTQGTLIHSWAESYGWLCAGHPELITEECQCKYIPDKNWLIPTRGKEESAKNCIDKVNQSLHLVMNETKVYTSDFNLNYAGTFDTLYYYKHPTDDSKSGLMILDYKTNKELYSEYNRTHKKMMLYPFNDLYDESFGAYTIQLNAYQIPLEDMGFKIIGRRVLWLKEDGEYEIIKVPDVTERLRIYLNSKR